MNDAIRDFLQLVAIGTIDPDDLARKAAELLEAEGYPVQIKKVCSDSYCEGCDRETESHLIVNMPEEALDKLLKESGLTVKFGLRAQGHIPTIERMLAEGKTWDEIGKAIVRFQILRKMRRY